MDTKLPVPSPLFVINISNGKDGKPIQHTINPDNNTKPWALLFQIGDKCCIYDFGNHIWLNVDYSEYSGYKGKYRFIEIRHRPQARQWGEISLTIPHPVKKMQLDNRYYHKKQHKEFTELEASPLKRFMEVESFLDNY
jgi:hypothetical protein